MSLTITLAGYTLPAPSEYRVVPRISGQLSRKADGGYSFAQHGSKAVVRVFTMTFRGLTPTQSANVISAWTAALVNNVTLQWLNGQSYTVRAQTPEPACLPDGVGRERVENLTLVEV